jgi:hypothetical protein
LPPKISSCPIFATKAHFWREPGSHLGARLQENGIVKL